MGQAKRRGTREERIAQALAKVKEPKLSWDSSIKKPGPENGLITLLSSALATSFRKG